MVTSFSSTKTLTFSTLGAVFIREQDEFQKFDFILIILAYSGFCTCLQIKDPPIIKEVRLSPRINVSDKPLIPQDARLSCRQLDINHMFV